MKTPLIGCITLLTFYLFAPQTVSAQGTTYLSSLSQTSTGVSSVGSDSWIAAGFKVGNNSGGYVLNSVQLGMAAASGTPAGFAVMIYAESPNGADTLPGSSIASLSGSLSPVTAGIYTYTPTGNVLLSPDTYYFIVITGSTTVANGAYEWSNSAFPPVSNGWGADNVVIISGNGSSDWLPTPYSGIAQFAINATPVPEPRISALLVLGGLGYLWQLPKHKAGLRKRIRAGTLTVPGEIAVRFRLPH